LDNFDERYGKYLSVFNAYAEDYFKRLQTRPEVLGESMKYSFLLGGKRLRPVLMLAAADALGVSEQDVLPYALALEMIHTYSLIHDDLPAMDNDDFRRGKPSNHKVFGEANAILAGDGLLNSAYYLCFEQCFKGDQFVLAAKFLCECAGISGMIAGQSADLYYSEEGREVTENDLEYVDEHKTGKLILAPVAVASILSGNKYYIELVQFGKYLGSLFQITDDILDETGDFATLGKSVGKDKQENKLTCVRLYGLDGAKVQADIYAKHCYAVLDGIDGDTTFLHDLITYVRDRSK
jgi:geranylgeranyl diphosphate synthase type II